MCSFISRFICLVLLLLLPASTQLSTIKNMLSMFIRSSGAIFFILWDSVLLFCSVYICGIKKRRRKMEEFRSVVSVIKRKYFPQFFASYLLCHPSSIRFIFLFSKVFIPFFFIWRIFQFLYGVEQANRRNRLNRVTERGNQIILIDFNIWGGLGDALQRRRVFLQISNFLSSLFALFADLSWRESLKKVSSRWFFDLLSFCEHSPSFSSALHLSSPQMEL